MAPSSLGALVHSKRLGRGLVALVLSVGDRHAAGSTLSRRDRLIPANDSANAGFTARRAYVPPALARRRRQPVESAMDFAIATEESSIAVELFEFAIS
jgi:hypothetical protein